LKERSGSSSFRTLDERRRTERKKRQKKLATGERRGRTRVYQATSWDGTGGFRSGANCNIKRSRTARGGHQNFADQKKHKKYGTKP